MSALVIRNPEAPALEVRGLKKHYSAIEAVKGIDLKVERGEIFGFLGPNGAGKTTTIRTLVGLLQPTAGDIFLGGFSLKEDPVEAKRIVGFIPDRPFLYEKLTGREFLGFIAGLYSVYDNEPEALEERIEELLRFFQLDEWGDELVEAYSHGMKQRLVMSSTLLHDPEIIIVDEPMVGLDPRGARLLKNLFKERVRGGGSIFMSTHTLAVAEELCDRIAIIQEGELIAEGTLQELRVRAGMGDDEAARLEAVFLKLTIDEEMIDIVDALRG
ncbi:ABC transporter ATP-binding protein [Gemmatimonadota bacterium]